MRTVVYLRRGADPPDLTEEESTALHHAHLAHLADLGRRGIIAANGPLLDQSDETMRGMSVYTVDAAEARRLAEQDLAVRAGRFRGGRGPLGRRGRADRLPRGRRSGGAAGPLRGPLTPCPQGKQTVRFGTAQSATASYGGAGDRAVPRLPTAQPPPAFTAA